MASNPRRCIQWTNKSGQTCTPTDAQYTAAEQVQGVLANGSGIIVKAPCGAGKSIVASVLIVLNMLLQPRTGNTLAIFPAVVIPRVAAIIQANVPGCVVLCLTTLESIVQVPDLCFPQSPVIVLVSLTILACIKPNSLHAHKLTVITFTLGTTLFVFDEVHRCFNVDNSTADITLNYIISVLHPHARRVGFSATPFSNGDTSRITTCSKFLGVSPLQSVRDLCITYIKPMNLGRICGSFKCVLVNVGQVQESIYELNNVRRSSVLSVGTVEQAMVHYQSVQESTLREYEPVTKKSKPNPGETQQLMVNGHPKAQFLFSFFAALLPVLKKGVLCTFTSPFVTSWFFDNITRQQSSQLDVDCFLLTGEKCAWYKASTQQTTFLNMDQTKEMLACLVGQPVKVFIFVTLAVLQEGGFDLSEVDAFVFGGCMTYRLPLQAMGRITRTPESLANPPPYVFVQVQSGHERNKTDSGLEGAYKAANELNAVQQSTPMLHPSCITQDGISELVAHITTRPSEQVDIKGVTLFEMRVPDFFHQEQQDN